VFDDDEHDSTMFSTHSEPISALNSNGDNHIRKKSLPLETILLQGVVFGRSVRMSFCSIVVSRLSTTTDTADVTSAATTDERTSREIGGNIDCGNEDESDEDVALIRVQFMGDNLMALRSYCRRFVKNGDLISVVMVPDCENLRSIDNGDHSNSYSNVVSTAFWQPSPVGLDETASTVHSNVWQTPRLVVNVHNIEQMATIVRVQQRNYWSMRQYQKWQNMYLPFAMCMSPLRMDKVVTTHKIDIATVNAPTITTPHHGGGLGKRIQGEYIASFLIHMIAQNLLRNQSSNDSLPFSSDPSTWAQLGVQNEESRSYITDVITFLNKGSGVFDVAGGSGHVSMALGMLGIHSTVIDPRENAGNLPKRDRKIWHKIVKHQLPVSFDMSEKAANVAENDGSQSEFSKDVDTTNSPQELYCQPLAVPFHTLRVWFGQPPDGVDTSYRHPDQKYMPVLEDDRIKTCSAIVALHPDEATDAIVDTAVRLRIPFVIVPCCVFTRLFPHRRMPNRPNVPVSTHQDLLDHLQHKDTSIRKATLPFAGSNTILWSCF
jgi:hypothetical protein